jgi:hypothetical protein
MKGFCKTGLLLLPKVESFSDDDSYLVHLNSVCNKLVRFFKTMNIQLEAFTTNDATSLIDIEGISWVSSACVPEDVFFIRKKCDMPDIPDGKELSSLYEQAREKYPIKRGLSDEERFDIVVKRDKYCANKYIADNKLIITLERDNNRYYKTQSEKNDGKIIVFVNPKNFMVKTFMSGNQMDPVKLLGYAGARRQIFNWEV